MLTNDLAETLSLDGAWQFALDPSQAAPTEIRVPGCWEAQGHSKFIDGPATYRRAFTIPAGWAGRRIQAEFDAVSYACVVSCNGQVVGEHAGLWTPFSVDLTSAARPGQENTLELVVYKPGSRYPMRSCLAGFLPDLASTFGGIWQPVSLRALECSLDDIRVLADYKTGAVQVQCRAVSSPGDLHHPHWQVAVYKGPQRLLNQSIAASPDGRLDATIFPPSPIPWSPERPQLYTVQVTLFDGDYPAARFSRRTGFRRLSAQGDQLLLNDRSFMLRGVLSWGWDPERLAPYYTTAQARAELRRVREMGFNLVKLCLFVPNPAYFEVADEEGVLLWQELPMWLPQVDERLRAQAPQEYSELARSLAHHPSAALYSLGCELSQAVDLLLLEKLNKAVRGQVRDVLVCDNSGSGESYGGFDVDFADFTDYHPYYDLHYFEPLLDHWRRDWQPPRPWIFGEFCDADTFRDQDEICQAGPGETAPGARPWWLTRDNPVTAWRPEAQAAVEWSERLAQANPGFSPAELVQTSYRQAWVIRKYTLEALRRRRGIGGYVITGLRDTPISTSGIWDDLGRAKWPPRTEGAPSAFLQINSDAVLSLDVGRRRTWQNGGDRPDRLDPYNYWEGDTAHWSVILTDSGGGFALGSAGARLDWTLSDLAGNTLTAGSARASAGSAREVLAGQPTLAGSIHCTLPVSGRAAEYTLSAVLSQSGRIVRNSWPIFIYPRPGDPPNGLAIYDPTHLLHESGEWLKALPNLPAGSFPSGPASPAMLPDGQDFTTYPAMIVTHLDAAVWSYITGGGRVLLLQQGDGPLPVRRCPFWRESVHLFLPHPLWERFPQRGHADLQFFGLASDLAFDTPWLPAALPPGAEITPIHRRLDAREFHISEYIFEASAGQGRLLACALRPGGGSGAQPAGTRRNIAGAALLKALMEVLMQG